MAAVSLSHWGLIEYPAERVPRVGEIGHSSYPYCLLAAKICPGDPPGKIWPWLAMHCRTAGVELTVR